MSENILEFLKVSKYQKPNNIKHDIGKKKYRYRYNLHS